jgi:putative spermidine/putrescine transport system substrate-binding protein
VDRAFKKLDQLKPNIVWWSYVGQSRQMLASGEAVMIVTYDNGIYFFNKTQKTNFGISRKDAITHVNYWGIVSGTQHEDNAYKFLQYASEPKPQAEVSNLLAISVPNRDALALVTDDLRPNLSANPANLAQSTNSDVDFWINNIDALQKRFDAWVAGE